MGSSFLAVAAAVVSAFIVSMAWYGAFAGPMGMEDDGRPPLWKIAVEPTRSVVVALVVAWLVARLGVAGLAGALGLGLVLWTGFPAVLLSGAVLWEGVPWRRAVLHAGDWLAKLLVVAVIVGLWG